MPPAVEATTPITNAGGPATCSDERQGRVGTTADDGVTSTGCARCRCWQGRTSAPTHFALVVVLRPLVGALTCDGELRKERLIRMSERSRARAVSRVGAWPICCRPGAPHRARVAGGEHHWRMRALRHRGGGMNWEARSIAVVAALIALPRLVVGVARRAMARRRSPRPRYRRRLLPQLGPRRAST